MKIATTPEFIGDATPHYEGAGREHGHETGKTGNPPGRLAARGKHLLGVLHPSDKHHAGP